MATIEQRLSALERAGDDEAQGGILKYRPLWGRRSGAKPPRSNRPHYAGGLPMPSLDARLLALEQRRTPAGAWLDMIILHGDEAMTAHQLSECERAARNNLPTLTVIIGGAQHGDH